MARIKKKRTTSGTRYQVLHYVSSESGPKERSVGTFKSAKEAKRKKAEIEYEGKRRDSSGKTMGMLLNELLTTKKPDLKTTSFKSFESCTRLLREASMQGQRVEDIPITRFETEQVDRLTAALAVGRALQTQRTLRSVLKQAFDLAVRWKWIYSNPCHMAIRISSKQPRAAAWTIEETECLREAAAAKANRDTGKWGAVDRDIIEVMIGTGCRRGEALGLDRRAVDLKARTVTIRQTVTDQYHPVSGEKIRPGLSSTPKTDAGYRTIRVPDFVLAVLRERLAANAKTKIAMGERWNPEKLLFVDPETGDRCSPQSFSLRMRRLTQKAGISTSPSPTHGLRHSHAQALLEAGTATTAISSRLGHADERTTLRSYLRPSTPMDDEAAALADTLFSRASADQKADRNENRSR